MFDNLKGLGSIASIMKDLPRIKEKMEEVKERLGRTRIDAETGGGAVKAVVNGQLEVLEITIDPAMLGGLVDPDAADDRAMAEDLIVGAVNAALVKARETAAREMQTAAGDLGLPLPAGALDGLLS